MSDAVIFETLIKDTERLDPFDASRWNFITDSNNSSYTNSVSFDCSSISTAQSWTDWRSAEIQVPLTLQQVINTVGSTAAPDAANLKAMALWASIKSGSFHLFDSINVLFDGRSVTQQITNQNFITNFNLLTNLSKDEEENLFDALGMAKDSSRSAAYSATNGCVNNKALYQTPDADTDFIDVQNKGYFKRLSAINTPASLARNALDTAARSTSTQRAVLTQATSVSTAPHSVRITQDLSFIATIRLRDFHDLFDKLEATKGSPIRITLNLNTVSSMVVPLTLATLDTDGWGTPVVTLFGQSNPLMLPDVSAGQCQVTFGADTTAATLTSRLVIGNVVASGAFPNAASGMLSNCRLYYKNIVLDPSYEEMILNKGRYKDIVYDDAYLFTMNLGTNTFNSQVGSQIPYLKKVIVMPYLAATANGTTAIQSFQSPFASAPATLDPLPNVITNFQATVGGKNMYQDTLQYGWQNFIQYFAPQQGLNGDYVNGLSSGLIGKADWESGMYGYYVVDVRSNSTEADFAQSKSIQLSGSVSVEGNKDVMAYVFAIYERKIKIDVLTGKIVE